MKASRAVILMLVGLGIAGALVLRHQRLERIVSEAPVSRGARLLELGSTNCRICRAMHDELALFREECGASIAVEEIDILRDEAAAQRYGVTVMPTQVFLDAEGRELGRHVGFLAKGDIRARFEEFGVECRP